LIILLYLLLFLTAVYFRWVVISGFETSYVGTHLHNLWSSDIVTPFLGGDAWVYQNAAQRLLKTGAYDFPFHPPLTESLLALVYSVFGNSFVTARILYIVMGAMIAVIFAILSSRWFDQTIGLLTGWLIALSFGLAVLGGSTSSEIPALLFVGVGLLCLDYQNLCGMVSGGIFLGLAVLARTESILFVFIYLFVLWITKKRPWKNVLVALVCTILTITPWIIRNAVYFNKSIPDAPLQYKIMPLSTNGPFNFFIGNGPLANGSFRRLTSDENALKHEAIMNPNNPVHRDLLFHGHKIAWMPIQKRPGEAIKRLGSKLVYYSRGLTHGFFHNNFPMGLVGTLRQGDIWTPNRKWPGYLILVLALAGFALYRKKSPCAVMSTGSFVISGVLNALIFFGMARLGLMLIPFVFIGMSCFLIWLFRRIGQRVKLDNRLIAICSIFIICGFAAHGFYLAKHPYDMPNNIDIFKSSRNLHKTTKFDVNKVVSSYSKALGSIENRKKLIVLEEELSLDLTSLAYFIGALDDSRSRELLHDALELDPSNALAWKMTGILLAKKPDRSSEAQLALIRYLEITPRASDAQQIRNLIRQLSLKF